jgi:hypothetical protein
VADEETDPATGPFSTPAFRLAGLFLLACVVAGALVVLIGAPATSAGNPAASEPIYPSSTAPAPQPTSSMTAFESTTSVSADSEPEAESTSVCGLPAGEQSIPVAAPSATWQIVGGRVAAPGSAVFGPAVVSPEGIGGCFAHSPTGALFAMMQSVALSSAAPDRIPQVAVVTQRGSRTNLFDAALMEAQREDAAAVSAMPADSSTLVKHTLLGYTFIDYTPGRATIAVAVGIGDPLSPQRYQPSMFTGVVRWEGGDWKFVYSAQTAGSMAPILSRGQYTRWAA